MKSVANKTQKPLSVPLPRGKTLHLGPGKTGQISSEAAEHPPLAKLVHAGEIEVFDDSPAPTGGTGAGGKGGRSFYRPPREQRKSPQRRPVSETELTHVASCQESTGPHLRFSPRGKVVVRTERATDPDAGDQECRRGRCASASRSPSRSSVQKRERAFAQRRASAS